MNSRRLLLALAVALVLLAWGPLLVTSGDEALSEAQSVTAFEGVSYGDVVEAYESAEGKQGHWRVEGNRDYDSFFDGDEGGFRWIVTYDAPKTDDYPELEFGVKRFTGGVRTREPNWSFLPDDQLEEYLGRDTE